MLIHNWYID